MHGATVLRLAVAGSRVDRLRLGLTAIGAVLTTVALCSALTVVAIGPDDGPYAAAVLQQSGLHTGVVIALVGLCVPVLVLLAQCSRIGAPARDRRLASIRLAGATPTQVGRIVTAEAGLGGLAGSLVGIGVYYLLRVLLDARVAGAGPAPDGVAFQGYTPDPQVALRFPTDVVVPWWQVVVVAVGVPLLVALGTAWAVRRVAFTPFGVVRRTRTRPPRVLPLVLLAVGVAAFFVVSALLGAGVDVPSTVAVLALLGGFVFAVVGVLTGQGAITQALGRLLVGRTSRPALLLAARRMVADPFAATRATAVLCVAVLIAAATQRLRQVTLAQQTPGDVDPFYANTYDLVDLVLVVAAVLAALGLLIAAAEGIVARRRTYAAVVAAGTPRGVVARAVLYELVLPLVPSLLTATVAGTLAAIGFFGLSIQRDVVTPLGDRMVEQVVPVPWAALGVVLGAGIVVAVLTTAAGLVFLRRATDVTELRAAA